MKGKTAKLNFITSDEDRRLLRESGEMLGAASEAETIRRAIRFQHKTLVRLKAGREIIDCDSKSKKDECLLVIV